VSASSRSRSASTKEGYLSRGAGGGGGGGVCWVGMGRAGGCWRSTQRGCPAAVFPPPHPPAPARPPEPRAPLAHEVVQPQRRRRREQPPRELEVLLRARLADLLVVRLGGAQRRDQRLVGEPVDVLHMVVCLVGALGLLLGLARVDALEDAEAPGGGGGGGGVRGARVGGGARARRRRRPAAAGGGGGGGGAAAGARPGRACRGAAALGVGQPAPLASRVPGRGAGARGGRAGRPRSRRPRPGRPFGRRPT
jgi:hypothetical protein